jgi:hypothetical protein
MRPIHRLVRLCCGRSHGYVLSCSICFEASDASRIVQPRGQPRALLPSFRLRTDKERERQGRPDGIFFDMTGVNVPRLDIMHIQVLG